MGKHPHERTHTGTPHTHAHSYTTPHQHVTHTKYTHTKYTYTQNTHIHTQTQELLDSVNENSMEKEKKLNASEWQAAKLRLDYQDTETTHIQFKDEVHTCIISLRAHCITSCVVS